MSVYADCLKCGVSFESFPSAQRKYCSRECSRVGTMRPLVERFWSRVDKNGPRIRNLTRCWVWTGATAGERGVIYDGRQTMVSRVAWKLEYGDAGDLHVLHRCDNPRCVRASHLFTGTHLDNMRDMAEKGRSGVRGDKHWTRKYPERNRGERNATSKLTEAQVRAILSRPEDTQDSLAVEYGVSRRLIGGIRAGRRWTMVSR